MKTFTAIAALAAVVPAVVGQQLTVNTPANVVQCEPVQITWSSTTPPYYLSFVPANQPTAPAIKQFPPQQETSYTWLVDLQANTNFNIALKDGTGSPVYSAMITINPSSNSSCINTSVNEGPTGSSGSSDSSPSNTSGGSSPTSGSNPTSGGSSASKSSSASASPSASPTASGNSNSAARMGSSSTAFGIAAIMGLVGAALF